ncbi:TetR/AcrR family transcriptional regulator [Streptomyces sp. Da 82-17]|uniref:TetR/AcrR family transcriptional regulator n=1 Tax=Streptomyces sp. Da 82-17 TaxID=3377116 RepID=UPI0038D3B28A
MTAEPLSATRPRNRRQLIVEAAGRLFSERGYHAASMEEIATGVGISAAALYRHFPNKYALFAECAHTMADRLVAALDELPRDAPPADVFTALIRVTAAHRASGGVYRWEARYLDRDDRRLLRAKFARVVGRATEAVRRHEDPAAERPDAGRPDSEPSAAASATELADAARQLRVVAALGAIGSITMHRTSIAQRRLEDLLSTCALRVANAGRRPVRGSGRAVELPALPVARSRRAEILAAAVPLFARDGFANVTNGQIAEAVGIAPSALYRHYPGKVDILAAACLQAAGLLTQAVDRALHGVTEPRDALIALAETYVAYSFEHTDLTSVAEAEFGGLPAELQRPLVHAQREHIAVWEQQLRLARPDLDPRQTRVLVHAGFGVVVEAGRKLRWRDSPEHRAAVTELVVAALGV